MVKILGVPVGVLDPAVTHGFGLVTSEKAEGADQVEQVSGVLNEQLG